MFSLSIIIMAYNEEHTLETVVCDIASVLQHIGCPYEIIVVDDGSRDATGARAEELARQLSCLRVIHHCPNQGLGGVYRTGFANATCDGVSFVPADGQFPAQIIEQFYPLIQDADMVLRYIPQRCDGWKAKALSGGERSLYRFLFGGFPRFQGILMFRRTLLSEFELKSKGRAWTIIMEFILRVYQARRYRIVSVPTPFNQRQHGQSKVVNWKTVRDNLTEVLRLRWQLWFSH